MSIRSSLYGTLVIAAAALFIAACAASSPRADTSNMQQRPTFDDPREEIEYLANEIDSMRRGGGGDNMGDSTAPTNVGSDDPCMAPEPMSDGADHDGGYDACADVCRIGTSICDNAERICRLAEQLAPDDWAEGKCEDANESCTAASANCDECRG